MPAYQFAATITSYREDDWTTLPPGVKYLAWSNETCPTTGRAHKQAFAYGKKTFAGWKAAFPGDHIEEMRGTFAENESYCSKAGALIKLGERPMENGKRRSSEKILALLESGERPTKIARSNPELLESVARYDKFSASYIHWWSDPLQEHTAAAKRRVTEIRLFKVDGSVEYQ